MTTRDDLVVALAGRYALGSRADLGWLLVTDMRAEWSELDRHTSV